MKKDHSTFLWLLKLGTLVNLFFIWKTLRSGLDSAAPQIFIPALIFFAVSAYRCLFPVRYRDNIVFHDSILSSIFFTRLLATLSEIALIFQLAYVLRSVNSFQIAWVDWLSWAMVIQVVMSQFFVWGAIVTGREILYYYEELGWGFIYAANTFASIYLRTVGGISNSRQVLILINIIFGAIYLPWQVYRLRTLHKNAQHERIKPPITWSFIKDGLTRSIQQKNPTSNSEAWGGLVGTIWMTAYWAALLPVWVYLIVREFSNR
jgi:hypothetical protein